MIYRIIYDDKYLGFIIICKNDNSKLIIMVFFLRYLTRNIKIVNHFDESSTNLVYHDKSIDTKVLGYPKCQD